VGAKQEGEVLGRGVSRASPEKKTWPTNTELVPEKGVHENDQSGRGESSPSKLNSLGGIHLKPTESSWGFLGGQESGAQNGETPELQNAKCDREGRMRGRGGRHPGRGERDKSEESDKAVVNVRKCHSGVVVWEGGMNINPRVWGNEGKKELMIRCGERQVWVVK